MSKKGVFIVAVLAIFSTAANANSAICSLRGYTIKARANYKDVQQCRHKNCIKRNDVLDIIISREVLSIQRTDGKMEIYSVNSNKKIVGNALSGVADVYGSGFPKMTVQRARCTIVDDLQ